MKPENVIKWNVILDAIVDLFNDVTGLKITKDDILDHMDKLEVEYIGGFFVLSARSTKASHDLMYVVLPGGNAIKVMKPFLGGRERDKGTDKN